MSDPDELRRGLLDGLCSTDMTMRLDAEETVSHFEAAVERKSYSDLASALTVKLTGHSPWRHIHKKDGPCMTVGCDCQGVKECHDLCWFDMVLTRHKAAIGREVAAKLLDRCNYYMPGPCSCGEVDPRRVIDECIWDAREATGVPHD